MLGGRQCSEQWEGEDMHGMDEGCGWVWMRLC